MSTLILLLPSLLSRYSTQTLVIAIPWLLQRQGGSLADISWALLPFYVGTLATGVVVSRWTPRGHVNSLLAMTLGVQAILSVLCFFADGVTAIAFLRLLQGAATGLSRPLAQVWALEHTPTTPASVRDRVLVTTMVQIAIAVGMALGSYVGARIGGLGLNTLGIVGVFAVPTIGVVLLVARRRHTTSAPLTTDRMTDQARIQDPEGRVPGEDSWWRWLQHSGLVGVYTVFFVSMAFYNLWPVAFPFHYRQVSPEAAAALPWLLVAQPVLFAVGQVITTAVVQRIPAVAATALPLLVALNFASIGLVTMAMAVDSQMASASLFLAGTGLAAATMYPLYTSMAMQVLALLPASRQRDYQRKFIISFGVTGDLGQVLGGVILVLQGSSRGSMTGLWILLVLAALPPLCHLRRVRTGVQAAAGSSGRDAS